MAWLIAKGHHSAQTYRYSFFKVAVDVAIENDNDALSTIAIGTRIAGQDGKEFKKTIDSLRPKKINHEENIKRFKK